jgi:hypothetical protein
LRLALSQVKEARAPKLAAKIRSAIKSAGGAIRHAELAPFREARQTRAKAQREQERAEP